MRTEVKQRIQLLLAVGIVFAGARTAYIFYERHGGATETAKESGPPLDPDDYVTPKKLHPYDLQSVQQLTRQAVWVKVGYSIKYFPYDLVHHPIDFSHPAGLLLPLEKLEIKQVVVARPTGNSKPLMAVFEKEGQHCAIWIGSMRGNDYTFYVDDMLFIQDPHELYKHWPAEIWEAIENHEVRPGMNELQADFAVGLGIPDNSSDPRNRTVNYPDGGRPLSVKYVDGKAEAITVGEVSSDTDDK